MPVLPACRSVVTYGEVLRQRQIALEHRRRLDEFSSLDDHQFFDDELDRLDALAQTLWLEQALQNSA